MITLRFVKFLKLLVTIGILLGIGLVARIVEGKVYRSIYHREGRRRSENNYGIKTGFSFIPVCLSSIAGCGAHS
jgi:hypothetical protein